jgi:ATP-dependent protease ClpP protease subunit
MKKVMIDQEIGYDWWTDSGITAKGIEKQLEGLADGEDIEIEINSPGGSVYEGVVIFNLIRDAAKTHPVSVRINAIAMSMASYIALAARTVNRAAKITVCDNSVVMIHNPWGIAIGDYRELQKDADYFEKLASMYGSVHAAVSGQPEKKIRKAMDDETYYVGREIVDAGFANFFDPIVMDGAEQGNGGITVNNRDSLIINAKIKDGQVREQALAAKKENGQAFHDDLEKAAALFNPIPKPLAAQGAKPGEKINGLGGSMKPEDLLAQDKACYDAVFALGEKAALEKERARTNAHIMLGKTAGSLDIAMKHIQSGASTSAEDVQAEYFAERLKKGQIDARTGDDPPPVNTGSDKGDEAKIEAAFDAGFYDRGSGGK